MVQGGSGLAFSLAFGVQALGLSPTIPKTQIIGFEGPNTIVLMYLGPKPPPPITWVLGPLGHELGFRVLGFRI